MTNQSTRIGPLASDNPPPVPPLALGAEYREPTTGEEVEFAGNLEVLVDGLKDVTCELEGIELRQASKIASCVICLREIASKLDAMRRL